MAAERRRPHTLDRPAWLDPSTLRIGLGCMRLSSHPGDEGQVFATIAAAVDAGITVFDTAHAYAPDGVELGHNERLLTQALRDCGPQHSARIVTKGGMARSGNAWVPDGRATTIRADCEASLRALDDVPIDLYLLHAPDPRTPWSTSLRALQRLRDDGLVAHVGVCNVNRQQLDQALQLADIAAVQVALSPYDDSALRGGVVERCEEAGISVMAHSPLGGPRRAPRLARNPVLAAIAQSAKATAAEVALAWLLAVSPVVVPTPGARRPETVRSAARAATLVLDERTRAELAQAFGSARPSRQRHPHAGHDAEVVLIMGIPGAGKTHEAQRYVARGYRRLNRDERGGSLREVAAALDEQLSHGERRLVLDNTYLTRAARSHVLDVAHRHGAAVRCVHLDTPLAQAQVNVVNRLLDTFGRLPTPEELTALARNHPGVMLPTSQMRTQRELEPPSLDEGLSDIEIRPFTRASTPAAQGAVFVAAAALQQPGWQEAAAQTDAQAPHLVFDWRPDATAATLEACAALAASRIAGPVETALCPHPAGPPRCWCRPPLPGLILAFARKHQVDPAHSILIGTSAAHRTMATTLGARYLQT